MKTLNHLFSTLVLFFLIVQPGISQEEFPEQTWLREAQGFLAHGQFKQCIQLLDTHLPLSDFDKVRIEGLHLRATAHHSLGQFQDAYDDLKQARVFSQDLDPGLYIKTLTRLSDLSLSVGQIKESLRYAQIAAEKAKTIDDMQLQAITLNNLGNALLAGGSPVDEMPLGDIELPSDQHDLKVALRGPGSEQRKVVIESDQPDVKVDYFQDAIANYGQCIKLAVKANDQPLAIRAMINKARTALEINEFGLACQSLTEGGELIAGLTEGFERGYLQLSRGVLAHRLAKEHSDCQNVDLKSIAADAYYNALQIGDTLRNPFLQSQAQGELAIMYEKDDRLDEAIQLTRAAVFAAHQQANPRLIYKWHWQLGRFLGQTGKNKEAISQYRQAIDALNSVRHVLSVGYRKIPDIFKNHIKPVYYELAEFYLKEAKKATSRSAQQSYMSLARDTIEGMKSAELQDYFQDECVIAYKSKATALNTVTPGTAVLYPIILKNQLVMLLSLADGIHHFSRDVSADDLNQVIDDYRRKVQNPLNNAPEYRQKSAQLFNWLIGPLEKHLQESAIDTLIIVPDGGLTLIPFSTLFDGEKYFIDRYAVVISPGLTLTDPHPLNRVKSTALLLGFSESVLSMKALPAVGEEISNIARIIKAKVLLNSGFTPKKVAKELKRENYRVIHMATHGKFDRDPEKTFLATHDGKISLNKLEELIKFSQFREEPLELLTLSACETAVGDEMAALGLAGVAVKSGARSVLASLWQVSDTATKVLMTEFYHQYFQNPNLTKAQALQIAQKKLIATEEFNHPSQWAPFLIIGNWL